jgi:thiol-disulfide isomerase/thioredoxin
VNRKVVILSTVALIVIGIVVAVVRAVYVSPAASTAPIKATLTIGQAAPPFQVSSTDGYIDSTAVHKPMLVEIFATWCPHCRREVAIMNDIHASYGDKLQMIAVNGSNIGSDETSPETQADVVTFAEAFHVTYPLAFDPQLTVAHDYLLGGFPSLVVIDKNGRISSFKSGEETEASLKKRINAVI